MTDATKPVRRKVRVVSNWIKTDKVVVTIYPHGELGLRELGRRTEYKVGLSTVWHQAVCLTMNRITARVKELKKVMPLAQARKQARKELL